MWFLFGFITFISFSLYFGYKRVNAAWKGKSRSTGSIDYQYKVLSGRYGVVTGFLIGIEGPQNYDFVFKRESWYDRLFKAIGISAENQVGNREFDELVYIVSDDKRLHMKLATDFSIVDAALNIFRSGETSHCKAKELRCYSGRLWVKFKVTKGFKESELPKLASSVVPLLQKATDGLSKALLTPTSPWKDPFVIRAAVILAISTGLAINGMVHLMRIGWTRVPLTLDSYEMLMSSLYWGGGIVVFLIAATIVLLGRSARTHLVLIELILVGAFGAVSTSFAELRDINMDFDQSSAVTYQAKTLDKQMSRGSKSTSYYLYMEDWNVERPYKKIKVSGNFYRQVSIGEYLDIRQKPGYLKYRWVESISKKM